MRFARSLLVVTPLVMAIVVCLTTGRSAANGNRSELGRPLEGLNMQQLKAFRDGKEAFEEVEEAADGLGPIFNNTGCAVCHSTPVTGGASAINETRAQKLVNGQLFEFPGGSLFQTEAISPNCAETIPPDANVRAFRQTTPLFGLGLVEAIPDSDIEDYARQRGSAASGAGGAREPRDRRCERAEPRRPLRLEGPAGDAALLQRRCVRQRDGHHQRALPHRERAERRHDEAQGVRPAARPGRPG